MFHINMRSIQTLFFFLVIAIISACQNSFDSDDSEVIASVGNQSLTMNSTFDQLPQSVLQSDSLTAVNNYLDQWIQSNVIVQHAERVGLQNNRDVVEKLERARKQVLEDALKQYILSIHSSDLEVSREEAQNYYQAHKEQFILDERYVRFRYITTRTRTEAENANLDLMRGLEWEEILQSYSVDPERQLRESNQFWPISMAVSDVPMINRYLRIIGLSERSPIHQFRNQYHLVQLIESRPAGDHPDLEWLIPQIKEWLKLEKARRITNNYLRNLYLEAEANNEVSRVSLQEIESLLNSRSNN